MGSLYPEAMRIIARKALREFWERHPDAEQALRAWYHDVEEAQWLSPTEIRQVYAAASFVANNRVVFNLRGNRYRLVVAVQYRHQIVYIRFIGSHADYDKIDAATI